MNSILGYHLLQVKIRNFSSVTSKTKFGISSQVSKKNCSQKEEEVLLKVVVQSIPTYAMSCFRLLTLSCWKLESLIARFWWGFNDKGNKIHWKNWKIMCQFKLQGGMGFWSFIHFNQSLLAKQAWRILNDPSSLISKLYKGRYFPNTSFRLGKVGRCPSMAWRGIIWGRNCWRKDCVGRLVQYKP